MQPPIIHEPMMTRMSSKGQVVIPRKAREALGLSEGTRISIRIEGGEMTLAPAVAAKGRSMEQFLAFAKQMREKYPSKPMSQKQLDQAIMDTVVELDERTKTKPRKRKRRQ